jgi:hypothetical protein
MIKIYEHLKFLNYSKREFSSKILESELRYIPC